MIATASVALTALLAAAQIQMEARFVAGDVLVRFASDSAGRPTSNEAEAGPRLDPFLAVVSREIGCPLVLRRVGSGGDLLLGVDAPALAARLKIALESHPGVTDASAVPPSEGDGLEPRVAVSVHLTAEASRVAEETSRDLKLPVRDKALPEGAHLFEINLRAFTLEVVQRLKARDDVDYAQPNYAATR